MAEEFMSRRARREAERRAAEEAFEARQASGQIGSQPADSSPAPSFSDAEVAPVRHERGPLAADRPIEEAQPQAAASRRRSDDPSAPAPAAEQAPVVQQAPEPAQQVQSTPSPAQPVSSSPKPEHAPEAGGDAADAAAQMPTFATRAERRRYMREHGLLPTPVDAPEGESAQQSAGQPEVGQPSAEQQGPAAVAASGPTAQDVPTAHDVPTAQDAPAAAQTAPMTPRPPAPSVADTGTPEEPRYPAAPARQASLTNLAGDLVDDSESSYPQTTGSQGAAAPASGASADQMRPEDVGTQRMAAVDRPDAPAPSPSAAQSGAPVSSAQPAAAPSAQQTAAPEQSAAATPVPDNARPATGAATPDSGHDLTARRQRRAPVVKPPRTEGIRVVTGAMQLTRTQEAIDKARRAEEAEAATASGAAAENATAESPTAAAPAAVPATQAPATDAPAQVQPQAEKSAESGAPTAAGAADQRDPAELDDHELRVAASGPMTNPIDAIPAEELEKEVEGDAVESWEAPDAGEGDELASPPVPPMSARQITHEDGDILYDGEPSKLPFIVLGVAGIAALALIVFALILIF